jgi:hypothetical protein
MAVTILEALQNVDYNLNQSMSFVTLRLAQQQLHNAIVLLEKGYDADELVEPLLEKYGSVENVPDKS